MEHGPLPPHERSWRHPSEIAAEERLVVENAPGPSALRGVAFAGGALGLIAIGLAVLTLTPGEYVAPVRLAAPAPLDDLAATATTFAALRGSTAATTDTSTVPATDLSTPVATRALVAVETTSADGSPAADTRTVRTTLATTPATTVRVTDPMADPIGATGYALIPTVAGVGDPPRRLSPVDVELPTGGRRTALTVAHTDVVTLVAIDPSAGSRLAERAPKRSDMVTIITDHASTEVHYGELMVTVAPGAAIVTDASGAVIGVCADHDGTVIYLPLVGGFVTDADEASDGP